MNLNSFLTAILSLFRGIFGSLNQAASSSTVPVSGSTEPVHRKVSVIVFDPTIPSAGGRKLGDVMGWNSVDGLIAGYVSDLQNTSAGYANFDIVERNEVDQFPVKEDKFVYSPDEYVNDMKAGAGFHKPDTADYHVILKQFDIVNKVNSGAIDEVWMFGFPYAGFYESRMVGPEAFYCNAPPILDLPACSRRFVIMGFSYERGVGEMLESLSHREEYTMRQVTRNITGDNNLWQRFIRYDKANPGKAEVGSVHYAPNSQYDYDWGNKTNVLSGCMNWLHFPDLSGAPVNVNCTEWGNGDIRGHHVWWLRHLPHVAGSSNGISNNWWEYLVDPNKVA